MPSPTRESVLGLYADSEFTKGEAQPTKARYSAFLGFAGELGPVCITALGKNLSFEPDLVKSYSNDNANTNISDAGDGGRQKLLCLLFAER